MYSEFLAVLGLEIPYGETVRDISSEGVRPDRAASDAERDPEPSLEGL
jgi:hypothetical protein